MFQHQLFVEIHKMLHSFYQFRLAKTINTKIL